MEILDLNILLPAAVSYRTDSGEHTVFCYLNQMNGDITLVDEVANPDELKKAIGAFMRRGRKRVIPPVPDEGFNKMDPKNYVNE